MPIKIEIFEQVVHRLKCVTSSGLTNLYGISYEEEESKILIMGFGSKCTPLAKDYSALSPEACSYPLDSKRTSKATDDPGTYAGDSSKNISCVAAPPCMSMGNIPSMSSNVEKPFSYKDIETLSLNKEEFPLSNLPTSGGTIESDLNTVDGHQVILPSGIDYIGLLGIKSDSTFDEEEIRNRIKDIQVTNTPPYLEKDNDELRVYYIHEEKLHPTSFDIMTSAEFNEKFCYLHLLGNITSHVPVNNEINIGYTSLDDLNKRISSEMIFRVSKSDIFISQYPIFHSLHSNIGKLFNHARKCKDYRTGLEVLRVYGLFPSTLRVVRGKTCYAPFVLDYTNSKMSEDVDNTVMFDNKSKRLSLPIEIPFDGLCVVHQERSVLDVYNLLIDAAERIVYRAEKYINDQSGDLLRILFLEAYHFFPNELGHPVSLIYTSDKSDDELIDTREKVHKCFNLYVKRPLFSRELALKFLFSPPVPLLNVHIGLVSCVPSYTNTKRALIYGSYEYYHYNMGGEEDNGWGCGYRSLQTIISWFKLQGYISKHVPSHTQIQQILVKMGGKDENFIGSRSRIGSTEIAYVLQYYLHGVTCKIINISCGSDKETLGPDLLYHFQNQGTPVVVGGGILAHTIIGVEYEENSSNVKFLILDPHYIGEEDVTTIQSKGYVSWKGIDFLNQNVFFNLCLPQRPDII